MSVTWQEQHRLGVGAEDYVADRFQRQFGIWLRRADMPLQRRGIDFVCEDRSYELKTDWVAGRTGNAFLELSFANGKRKGWLWTIQADWLLYYIPTTGELLGVKPVILRSCAEIWLDDQKYPIKICNSELGEAEGLCAPLTEVRRIATKIVNIGTFERRRGTEDSREISRPDRRSMDPSPEWRQSTYRGSDKVEGDGGKERGSRRPDFRFKPHFGLTECPRTSNRDEAFRGAPERFEDLPTTVDKEPEG